MLSPNRADVINPPPTGCTLSIVSSCGGASAGGTLANTTATAWIGTEIIPGTPSGSTSYNIDAASINISSITGDVSAVDYVCEVYTVAANGYDLDTKVGSTSDIKTGLTTGWNEFTFATTITITNAATYGYCLIFRRNDFSANASNYANLTYGTANWSTGEAANYLEGYNTLLASGLHATLEYSIRWSDCD